MFSMRPGLSPSPPRFHSMLARPAARICFPPTPSNMTSPPSREVLPSENSVHRAHAFQLSERLQRPFLRRQFHGLAILGLALPPDGRQLAGFENWNAAPKSAAHRHAPPKRAGRCRRTERCARHRANRTAVSCRQCPPPRLHPAPPIDVRTAPVSISSKLCSVFASNPSLRKTSVAAAVGAQNSGSIFASAQAATNSRNAVVLPVPARPRRPVMRSLVRRT